MTASVDFDVADARTSTSAQGDGTVLRSLRDAAQSSGLDVTAELYNEALELAHEGHYKSAQHRLHVLLGLAPSDGDAHLLLAKVLVAGQQWRRALAALDEAQACGAPVTDDLREAVMRHLHADDDAAEAQRRARKARSGTEVDKLRGEARRLRSDNAHLTGRIRHLEREVSKWAWVATGTSVVAILFMLGGLFGGGGEAPVAPTPDGAEAAATPTPGSADAAAAAADGTADEAPVGSPRNGSLAEAAGAALVASGVVSGGELEVIVRGSTAELSGTVPSHAELVEAVGVLEGVDGITAVGTDGVINLSRRDGTTHEVASGETLGQIAYAHYGTSALYPQIVEANPSLEGGTRLSIGQTLTIPPVRED